MTLRFTILGCGYSGGVPRIGLGWGACDPTNPRNRRRRCSLLAERRSPGGRTVVLVDTSPDLREQLLAADVDRLDAVLYTHPHADHVHGIDDLRGVFLHLRRRIDVHLDEPTAREVRARFGYCFATPPGSEYPPILNEHRIVPGQAIEVEGPGGRITAMPVPQDHGDIPSLGFRIGNLAYSADLKDLAQAGEKLLGGLDIWIVDALRDAPHSSHFNVAEALDWIARLRPKRAILTNLHADLDYEELRRRLPPHVEPAYDGMTIELKNSD